MPSNLSLMALPRAAPDENIKTVQAQLVTPPAISLQLYVHPVEQRDQEASARRQTDRARPGA